MPAYYNEIDPFAANWLRNLIKAGLIADGVVDTRSIEDVRPEEIRGFTQCHFFAGIGVWSYALRSAGWPDDREVWTGSCPCQPFSAAGKNTGFADERHLWPAWFWLIEQRRPAIVFGEQVASKAGLGWFDLVSSDLERTGYAVGAADLCAAGIGAPHIRQRLWFVAKGMADAVPAGRSERGSVAGVRPSSGSGVPDRLGHSINTGLEGLAGDGDGKTGRPGETGPATAAGEPGGMADPQGLGECPDQSGGDCGDREQLEGPGPGRHGRNDGETLRSSPTDGFWRDADWLFCRDGKFRPVESGTHPLTFRVDEESTRFMLARQLRSSVPGRNRRERRRRAREIASVVDLESSGIVKSGASSLVVGSAGRVGKLRGYGNAIVAPLAKIFIETVMEVEHET